MSGGHFDYFHWKLDDFLGDLATELEDNPDKFSPETMQLVRNLYEDLSPWYSMLRDMDYMYSGDISEEEFRERIITTLQEVCLQNL